MPGCVHHVKKMTGGGFEPVEPPIEKPEDPTTPPSTKDLRTIKVEENIMAVVGTNNWNAIAYGNGKYVAVGKSGYVTMSTNGTSWTTPKQVGSTDWIDIAYGNGKFFMIAGKTFCSSSDGINWSTPEKLNLVESAKCIACGNGIIILGCYQGILYASFNDGKDWQYTSKMSANFDKVAYGAGKFVALNSNGQATYSEDGLTWENLVSANIYYSGYPPVDIVYGNGVFLAVGYSKLSTSEDAVTWTAVTSANTQKLNFKCAAYSNGLFIAIGSIYQLNVGYTYYMITSKDGKTWTTKETIKDENGQEVKYVYDIVAV